jgi:hypothetical protein
MIIARQITAIDNRASAFHPAGNFRHVGQTQSRSDKVFNSSGLGLPVHGTSVPYDLWLVTAWRVIQRPPKRGESRSKSSSHIKIAADATIAPF